VKTLQWFWFLFLASFLPGWVNNVLGQDEQPPDEQPPAVKSIVTDRPSFTTGPVLVDPGTWQLELGYTFHDGANGTSEDVGTFPETSLRYGLDEKWELRFGWNGYDFVDDADDEAGDTSIGFKYALGDQLIAGTSLALITTVALPTGSGESELDPQWLIGWERPLDDQTTLAGNFGIGAPTDEMTADRFAQGILSVMCSHTLNDTTSGFAEYFTNFPAADDEDAEHVVQAGLMHLLNPDMQLDVRAGVGLNSQADDWFVGVGFSHRF
jgi:hypothetical protein